MAKEYIERDALMDFANNHVNGIIDTNDIARFPAADVVEVVRCKDCTHWLNEEGLDDHVCLKIYSDGAVSQFAWQHREPNDFCSYGERMDNNAADCVR